MTFANHIRDSGRTRAQWADELGVSRSFMSDLLNGNRRPSLELAVRIERATGGRVPAISWVPDASDVSAAPESAA